MDLLSDDIEYTILQLATCKVYQIPPSARAAGHKAGEWSDCVLDGKLRVQAKNNVLSVQIHSRNNELFAVCPVDPMDIERSIERVQDSSRYFVLKLQGPNGEHAFVGMGFEERNDAFDFWASLVDFQRQTQVEKQAQEQPATNGPDLSYLRMREGETISLGAADKEQQGGKKPLFKLPPPPKK